MRSLRFSVRGQLLFIRGGHLRLPLQHPSGEGLHGAVLHRFAGLDHQVEKAAGDLPLAQLLFNAQGALFSKKQESRTERSGIEVCTT